MSCPLFALTTKGDAALLKQEKQEPHISGRFWEDLTYHIFGHYMIFCN
jgi:hypothetical protein